MFYSSPTHVDPIMVQLSLLGFEADELDSNENAARKDPSADLHETCWLDQLDQPLATNRPLEKSTYEECINRIYHLEQALDQAMACIDDMRQRVQDQELLEAQLAATEEFATVQQQAIARLKLRLQQQQQQLRTQTIAAEERDRLNQEQVAAVELRLESQQAELELLRAQFSMTAHSEHATDLTSGADGADDVAHRQTWAALVNQVRKAQATLEIHQRQAIEWQSEAVSAQALSERLQVHLAAAQQQIQDLSTVLYTYEERVAVLESQLQEATPKSASERTSASRLKPLRQPNPAIATLGQDLARAQIKVEELEIELARQLRLQALWQQGHQELASECDRQRAWANNLNEQIAEMQEQILQQARQATEYETAIQHWKERYLSLQHQVNQLLQRLNVAQQGATNAEIGAIALLQTDLQDMLESAESETFSQVSGNSRSRFSTLDVPDFLLRRRNQRAR